MLYPDHIEPLRSLPDVHGTVKGKSFWRFLGPGFLVSVGYMDPGNWATDLEGGSRFGYQLLWVILASNLIAIFLQALCARLGVAGQLDLAQACHKQYSKPVRILLWLLAEVAMIATDVAEVIGSAIALNLLFGIPKLAGVLITAVDVLLILGLLKFGFQKIEAFIITLVATISVCFMITIVWAQPNYAEAMRGLIPSKPTPEGLGIAIGILGATVMPHNLYLHSAVVQTRSYTDKKMAVKSATLDSTIALAGAFFVNAAILVLAAAVFHTKGVEVGSIEKAHELLRPMLGGAAATLFAVALLASGQSSTVTGTLAGQVVMEGFLNWKIAPWMRRLITRGLALIPAVMIIVISDGKDIDGLVLSQIVLSMQLPFAIIPLMMASASKQLMGDFAIGKPVFWAGMAIGGGICLLNVYFLAQKLGWIPVGLGVAAIAGYFVAFRNSKA